jgi:hypothetical protein
MKGGVTFNDSNVIVDASVRRGKEERCDGLSKVDVHSLAVRKTPVRHGPFGFVWVKCQPQKRTTCLLPVITIMPIVPITGKLRKRLWLDLSCGLGLGIASAYAYWSVFLSTILR